MGFFTYSSISIGQLFAQYLSNIDKHLVANATFSRYTIETRENTITLYIGIENWGVTFFIGLPPHPPFNLLQTLKLTMFVFQMHYKENIIIIITESGNYQAR